MSNFLIEKNGIKYYAVDGFFGSRKYGYIKLDDLEGKKFLTEDEFNNL